MADIKEIEKDPSPMYYARPSEDDMYLWHFTLRGPPDTEFDGGIYHGKILLPPEYPFKPPNIVFLTPNGRFQVGTKVRLDEERGDERRLGGRLSIAIANNSSSAYRRSASPYQPTTPSIGSQPGASV